MTLTSKTMTRRRMIAISAGFAGLGGAAALNQPRPGSQGVPGQTVIHEWRGIALGAETSIKLAHEDRNEAVAVLSRCRTEIDRLEDIFSLYRPGSEIVRLNADGELKGASTDFERCLEEARRVSIMTDGAFDITVAPLWDLYAQGGAIAARRVEEIRSTIDYRSVHLDPGRVAFEKDRMAITLNGIAQGYITDRIAELLREYDYSNSLVSLGEFRALEAPESGSPWKVGIDGSEAQGPETQSHEIALVNAALATSSAEGLVFKTSSQVDALRASHLIDPRTGKASPLWEQVSVVAPSAARADALSTGLSFIEKARWADILSRAGAHFALGRGSDGQKFRIVPETRQPH